MLELLAGFITELRNAGLPVSLTENLDAMHAISHIPLEDREAFKYALGATLVKNNAHWRSFETVFEVYFSLRGPEYSISDGEGSIEDFLQQMQDQQMQGEGNGGAGGMDSLTPEEIAQKQSEQDRQLEMATAPNEYRFIGFLRTSKAGVTGAFMNGEEPTNLKIGSIIRGRWKLVEIKEDNARFQNLKYPDLFFAASASSIEN